LQATILTFKFGDIERAINEQLERVGIDRLLVKIVGALGDRRQCIFLVAVAGNDNDFRVRRKLERFGQRREALFDALRLRRKAEVLQDNARLITPQFGYPRSTI
jgi:hypothetical protein